MDAPDVYESIFIHGIIFTLNCFVSAYISEIPVIISFFVTYVLFSIFVFKLLFVVTTHLTLSFLFLFFFIFFPLCRGLLLQENSRFSEALHYYKLAIGSRPTLACKYFNYTSLYNID